MGLFDSKSLLQKKIESIINTTNYEYKNILEGFDFSSFIQKFNGEKLLCDILTSIVTNNENFEERLNYIVTIYESICTNPESIEEEYTFRKILEIYLETVSYFENDNNFLKVSRSFNDKKLVLEFFSFLKSIQYDRYKLEENSNISNSYYKNLSILIDYLPVARQYYVDDRSLLTSTIDLFNNTNFSMINSINSKRCKDLVAAKLSDARKANGVYDVDQETLAEIDQKINESDGLCTKLEDLIVQTDKTIIALQGAKDEFSRARLEEIKNIRAAANKIISNFYEDYTKVISEQRDSLIGEKDAILSSVQQEVERLLISLRSEGNMIATKAALEVGRIRKVSSESIQSFEKFVSDNDEIKKMIEEGQSNSDFATYLAKMEKLLGPLPGKVTTTNGIIGVADSNMILPSIIVSSQERAIDSTVNYYFDRSISYRERFDRLMEEKQRDIEENGSIYHEKFDDIAAIVMQNDVPYMYGPSGCGKTYMITEQLAKLLNVDVVTNGYVLYEQDILGYTNSGTGSYVPSNFYRCYKFGDMLFFDELDNGVASATVVLNHFLGGKENGFYTFPDGARLSRHPNFRILAAGNTSGSGKTVGHNTRQKMDESVMQRMTPIRINYDNRIEERILKDYPDWYNFAINFRKAIESTSQDIYGSTSATGTFTTRDAESVKRYKDDETFTDEQLMEYEILENKERDYLENIRKKLESYDKNGEFTEEGRKLLTLYKQHCEMRSKK